MVPQALCCVSMGQGGGASYRSGVGGERGEVRGGGGWVTEKRTPHTVSALANASSVATEIGIR